MLGLDMSFVYVFCVAPVEDGASLRAAIAKWFGVSAKLYVLSCLTSGARRHGHSPFWRPPQWPYIYICWYNNRTTYIPTYWFVKNRLKSTSDSHFPHLSMSTWWSQKSNHRKLESFDFCCWTSKRWKFKAISSISHSIRSVKHISRRALTSCYHRPRELFWMLSCRWYKYKNTVFG